MKESIYRYTNYKKYLLAQIEASENNGRGQRKLLADAMNSPVSHVSNVLNGSQHLSLEQAEACTRHFGFNEDETEFFLLLLQFNRAGTTSLKKVLKRNIDRITKEKSKLKNRLKIPQSLNPQHELEYYSSWEYAAVHVLLTIPELQNREKLAKRLSLNLERIDQILSFLVSSGLAEKSGISYTLTENQIHLGKESHLISKHHTNWRVRTLREFENLSEESLHYSAAVTLSQKDFENVREILSKALSKSLKTITQSKEEDFAVLGIDFYRG